MTNKARKKAMTTTLGAGHDAPSRLNEPPTRNQDPCMYELLGGLKFLIEQN